MAPVVPPGFPRPLSPLVGRRHAVDEIAAILPETPLLTLRGPPGIGKTRLAVEAAAVSAASWTDATYWVSLEDATDAASVVDAIASALAVAGGPGKTLVDDVVTHLQRRRVLVVLDTCEHVAGICAEVVRHLLDACGGLSLLATSRHPLALPGERSWPVPPLSLPDGPELSRAERSEAVQLFCQRASQVLASFTLDEQTAPAVAEVCRRLDGVALDIELAAGRLEVLSPVEIVDRLDELLVLCATRGTGTPPRHRSLRAALDWSHHLLSDAEQVLLRRLSVFAGGFTMAAVEEVCTTDGIDREDVLDHLTALVSKSLVMADTTSGETRYKLSEGIRQYGAERLATSGELTRLRLSHAAWSVALVERASGHQGEHRAVKALDAEYANVASAFNWAIAHERKVALRLTAGLLPLWRERGWFDRQRQWFEAVGAPGAAPGTSDELPAVAFAPDGDAAADAAASERGARRLLAMAAEADPFTAAVLEMQAFYAARAKPSTAALLFEDAVEQARRQDQSARVPGLLRLCGTAHMLHGDAAAARVVFEQWLEAAPLSPGNDSVHAALLSLGRAELALGELDLAAGHLNNALSKARSLGDRHLVTHALGLLGELARLEGRWHEARALLGEGLDLARKGVGPFSLVLCLVPHGYLALADGDPGRAERSFAEALAATESAGLDWLRAHCLHGLGQAARATGAVSTARSFYMNALAVARDETNVGAEAAALRGLGDLALAGARIPQAVSLHDEALRRSNEAGDRVGVADSLEACARVAAQREAWSEAALLFGAAASLRAKIGAAAQGALYEAAADCEATARHHLASEAFEAARARGWALSMEDAVFHASKRRGPRREAVSGWEGLTPAERRVGELVAQGLTNREVGDRLFVSARTVQNHLAKVFVKLGVKSRRELRAAVGED